MHDSQPRYYADTCIFTSIIENEQNAEDGRSRSVWSQLFLEQAERGECIIYTSAFTIAELNGGSGQTSRDVQDRIAKLFDAPYIVPISLSIDIALEARNLIWRLRDQRPRRELPGKDAIHIASAIAGGCSHVVTWDRNHMLRHRDYIKGVSIVLPAELVSERQARLDL